MNEFATVAQRKLKLSWFEVGAILAERRSCYPPPLPITVATHEAALTLVSRHNFAFYDALIIASALETGCATLLSEDMGDEQVVQGRLTISNPFRQD